jgi:hypothetical protein
VGWSLIAGYAYNYKFDSFGPLEKGVYDVDMRYRLSMGHGIPVDTTWQRIQLTRTLEEIEKYEQWFMWVSWAPGSWTGWFYP